MITIFEALADPTRRRILDLLREQPRLVGELTALLNISQPGVSKQLRLLREVGLVTVRQDAQRHWYELRPEPLAEIDAWKMALVAEPNKHELHTSRAFNAPRELVFKVFTDPALVPLWWGPRGYTTIVDQMDVKKGGIWRYIQRGTDGSEYIFSGVYHEISAPERIIFTMEYEGNASHVMLETLTFEDRDSKTHVTDSLVFQSVADRDGAIQVGMEYGAADTWDRLEEILNTM